jgi:REP element-mobilizing transposase RayT
MNLKAHSRDLRRNRLIDVPATFFITKSLYPKKPALDAESRKVIVSALEFAVRSERIYLRAFSVMLDHWHALFAIREPWTLPRFMHSLMSFVAARTSKAVRLGGTAWQDTYYDTHVKTAKQFAYIQNYIEQNPVVKGLVDDPEQWDASSANRTDLVTEPWPWFFD